MVDKIDKINPHTYRVDETADDTNRQHPDDQADEEHKDGKDDFAKKEASWKKLVPEASTKSSSLVASRWESLGKTIPYKDIPVSVDTKESPELSLTMSQRILVLWGVLDLRGKPRIPVIGIYSVVIALIAVSAVMILRMLWR